MVFTCLKNEPLDKYTSFKVGGKAMKAYIPASKDDLPEIFQEIENAKENFEIFGHGSNVLISSQGIDGSLILTRELNSIQVNNNIVYAECGCYLPLLARKCMEHSLCGLEFLTGIPGSVGGAIFMNASAHGLAISDYLEEVEVFDLHNKKFITYFKNELSFEYRKSDIHKNELIISAKFRLPLSNKNDIQQKMNQFKDFRLDKQPKGFNAGSVFRNPQYQRKLTSGYLLEMAGVKGLKEGGAEVSRLHANFINNTNQATSLDITKLMFKMHNAVKDSFGLKLRPEIKFVGTPTKEEEVIWKILKAQ